MDTKDVIVQKAFKILSKEGPKALTTSRLIEDAGISKGGLYHHFKEMDEIYMAVLEMLVETLTEGFYELEFDSVDHLNDVLVETIFDDIEETKQVYSALFYFISLTTKKPEYKEYLKNWSEASLQKWAGLYRKQIPEDLSDERLDTVMRMCDMYFGGLVIHDFILDDVPKYKRITREFLSMVTVYMQKK